MKHQAFNPYLPGNEYIPDAEPYVFGDRIYVYGSHDRFGAPMFCMEDYVCWSAPVDDPGNWRYEGVIYQKKQDPKNRLGLRLLFAPDVVRGSDGRYYLYYAFDFMGIMGVAVCESPCGRFSFLGYVRHADGTLYGRRNGDGFPFDPGVLVDDDKRIYLYSGFYIPVPAIVTGGKKLKFEGGYAMELESDMLTIKGKEKLLFPKEGEGAFPNHEFFEASSIRKYDGKYYFVYSSRHNHELCWAVSDRPMEGFTYGGTLISNGDLFLDGRADEGGTPNTRGAENADESHGLNYMGNNHGGMLELNGAYYIFYHRHTNRTSYARQTCAERLERDQEGSFKQAEMTSCGLNGGPLKGEGRYEARIACHLWSQNGVGRYDCKRPKKRYANHPYFTQDGKDGETQAKQYIANMQDGSVAGFKYFEMTGRTKISITVRGDGEGKIMVYEDALMENKLAEIVISCNKSEWKNYVGEISKKGKTALYFKFSGTGNVDFKEFALSKDLSEDDL